ncbi:DUF6397 family protein [Streptomyces sp. IBSBF 3136]|uniref:DUF6397 family protein n=1 Tax=Streptomyces sp. IBSBF 3136 TaxID=2903524 RepID=UPI002FDBAA58
MPDSTFVPSRPATCSPGRAARELGLKRADFDLAVHLGRIRTVPDESGGGGRRVERAEIDRLRAEPGFPGTLIERVHVVGTAEGAALMHIPAGRFTRLARLGLLVPVRFYVNRYRAVVWLYLAEELRHFAAQGVNARLLKGRTPETLRGQLAAGVDLRARNWRGRHLGFLLRKADDPWARAGALAALLPLVDVHDVVKDPYERAHLNRYRPAPPDHGAPGSPSALLAEELMTAQDADEIGWLRSELGRVAEEARAHTSAPRPTPRRTEPAMRPAARHPRPVRYAAPHGENPGGSGNAGAVRGPAAPHAAPTAPPTVPGDGRGPTATRAARGLRGWLRRRTPRPAGV